MLQAPLLSEVCTDMRSFWGAWKFTLKLCQSDRENEFQDVFATDIVLEKENN